MGRVELKGKSFNRLLHAALVILLAGLTTRGCSQSGARGNRSSIANTKYLRSGSWLQHLRLVFGGLVTA
tara:strand:+ start:1861 stop:2067 length:207 start_codon:yes stop_codon:yes gene_type:complete